MVFVGITGGVGAGKSTVMNYLAGFEGAQVLLADDLAKELMAPGTACYKEIVEEFGQEAADVPAVMAALIYAQPEKRLRLNAIVHPAVKAEVVARMEAARQEGGLKYFFFEAALLLDDNYDAICDEVWYVYASEEVRRARLKASRGYSDERIDEIFASQLSEAELRARCGVIIDNNGGKEATISQVAALLQL